MVFANNFPQYRKMQQNPLYGRIWEIGTHTFPISWMLFSHSISTLRYTSAYGKYMGFAINFPWHGKMQQNPLHREKLGNWYSYFSHSMDVFTPLDHLMVYFIIWKIHVFSHQFPIAQKKATKSIEWGKPQKLVLLEFLQYRCFFSIRLPSYSILHHMVKVWVFSSISHIMEKTAKPLEWGEPEKLVPILF